MKNDEVFDVFEPWGLAFSRMACVVVLGGY